MADHIDPPPNPETPWEFLQDDDLREELAPAAEDAAMHVETPGLRRSRPADDPDVVVHYLDDEHPEITDRSLPSERTDITAEVEDLLIRQHYLSADVAPDESDD